MTLPPVPQGLRDLAGRQLANPKLTPLPPNTVLLRTTRQWLQVLATLHKNMQLIMLDRQKNVHPLTQVRNEVSAVEWSRRLLEFDQCIQALREAWEAHKEAAPEVKRILTEWREGPGKDLPQTFTHEQDDDELVLHLYPLLEEARAQADALTDEAVRTWIDATTRYLQQLGAIPPQALAA